MSILRSILAMLFLTAALAAETHFHMERITIKEDFVSWDVREFNEDESEVLKSKKGFAAGLDGFITCFELDEARKLDSDDAQDIKTGVPALLDAFRDLVADAASSAKVFVVRLNLEIPEAELYFRSTDTVTATIDKKGNVVWKPEARFGKENGRLSPEQLGRLTRATEAIASFAVRLTEWWLDGNGKVVSPQRAGA